MVSLVIFACLYSGVDNFLSCSIQRSTASGGEFAVFLDAIRLSIIFRNSSAASGARRTGGMNLKRIGNDNAIAFKFG